MVLRKEKQHHNVVCPFCSLLCDDLTVITRGNAIVEVNGACNTGLSRFINAHKNRARCMVHGAASEYSRAVQAAAEILSGCRHPLIFGLSSAVCEAQKEAVLLAQLIKASIDVASPANLTPSVMAVQLAGFPTCTLGEVKNRADVVVFWGCGSGASCQQFFSRFSINAKGEFITRGEKDRFIISVDTAPAAAAKYANLILRVDAGQDYEVLGVLRGLIKGKKILQQKVGGICLEKLKELAKRLKQCRYGVFVYGTGLASTRRAYMNVAAAVSLVRDLNSFTRFSIVPVYGDDYANVSGVQQIFASVSGYPLAVNFSREYPRYNPGEFSAAELISNEDVDGILMVGAEPEDNLPGPVLKGLKNIPLILINSHHSPLMKYADVVIPTTVNGVGASGTYFRVDGVPLYADKLLDDVGYISDFEALKLLSERLCANVKSD